MEEELSDGEIVWVKVSNSWWPGEVMGESRLSEEFLASLRKKPLAVVKFFQEDSYEYVKNPNFIFKYNCPRKNEFLRKGLEQYRAKMKHMEKFPADVMHAERVTGGDPDIVNSTDFQPQKKERYSGLFQEGRSPATSKGGQKGLKEKQNTPSAKSYAIPVPFSSGRKTMHEVRILAQPSSTSATDGDTGAAALPEQRENSLTAVAQPISSSPGQVYHCYKCNNYSANRQNLIMLHIKHCRMSYTVGGGGLSSSSSTTTPVAAARKVSREKVNDSAAEEDLDLAVKTDHSRRSLPTTSKAKPFEKTPIISSVELMVPSKDESSNAKRTRGGRKSTALSEMHKPIARRRNKRGQSPDVYELSVAKSTEAEDDHPSDDGDKSVEQVEADIVSVLTKRDESPTRHQQGAKNNSTDVKLKNELLADWSEDEQEDDEGVKESGLAAADKEEAEDISFAEKKIPPRKEFSPVRTFVGKASANKRQHKESRQETGSKQSQASKKAIKAETINDESAILGKDEQSVSVKLVERDLENSQEDSSTGAVATGTTTTVSESSTVSAGATAAAVSTIPSASTTAPTASPHATIKYRNIPKKQKREFIEVTNDDVSMVQEKYAVPSREGSTASSSSTNGSNELCTGSTQSTTAPVPTAERPISAKQLILNRATRGSSKSLSGDENTTATAADDSSAGTTTLVVIAGTEGSASEDLKSQSNDAKKKTQDTQRQESSCFDFNDDEEERQQQSKVPQTRLDRKHEQSSARAKPASLDAADASQEEDRDVKLCQEIDSLLCEMDVPKLPEDLSDVMAAVSDKIDCNRTLPPKERGKRIFKTRNKTVSGIASSSSLHPSTDEVAGETEEKVQPEPVATNDAKDGSSKKSLGNVVETEAKRAAKDRTETKKQEDHQNPSVTSSAMTEETIVVKPMDVDQQQQQSAKKKRKSEEPLLPDSSGSNGEPALLSSSARRRGKFGGKSVTEGTEQTPSDTHLSLDERGSSSSSSRKAKRSRRELTTTTTTSTVANSDNRDDAENTHRNTSERASGRKKEPVAMVTEEATDDAVTLKNEETSPPHPVKKQSTGLPAAIPNTTKPKSEEIFEQSKSSSPIPPSTSIDALKATATDLQVAEALINLPVATTAMASVSSSEEKHVPLMVNDVREDAVTKEAATTSIGTVVRQTTTASSGSSLAKSINPRKRHLQSMMLTTTEETKSQTKQPVSSESAVPSSVLTDDAVVVVASTKQDPPSIPENKVIKTAEKEETNDELMENDKFDINNMPIVMDDSEMLVDDASSSSVPNAATIAVVKGVNGASNAPSKVGVTPIHTLTTTTAPPRDGKRQTTVASVKGGRASKEQIVITSKGTILTTSTANVTVASKFSTTTKPSISVTSAITLASSCRVASSTPTLAPNGSPSPTPPPSTTAAAAAASSVTAQSVPPKIILTKKPLPNAAIESVKSSKMQERRLSGDGGSSSVSSSSGSDAGSKKSHRVLRLTPQKLKEFSRLGYIEDRQGKGKMLTKSGMRQLYGKQAQLKQQQQRIDHQTAKKKPVSISTKIVTTTGGGADSVGLVVGSDSSTGSTEVASSGSNVVIAAAADSSVQESSATVERSAIVSDPSVADMDEEEEALMLDQHNNKVATEMAPTSGTTMLVDGSSPTSSGTTSGPVAEVILGSPAELTMASGGGSLAEATSSSSGSSAATAATGSGVQESSQLVAVTAENFGGPPHLFYLCSVRDETFVRVNDELLYLDASNQLVALPEQQHPTTQQQQQQQGQHPTQPVEDIIHQAEVILPTIGSNGADLSGDGSGESGASVTLADGSGAAVVSDGAQQSFLLNTQDGQHIILDQQSLMALAAGGDTSHIITADGQQIVLQETAQEWLAALSAGQQQQQAGTVSTLVTPEGTQIIVAHETAAGLIELQEHPVLLPSDIIQVNPNTTIETNAVLTKPPIMSAVEVPTKNGIEPAATSRASEKRSATVAPRMATGSSSTVAAVAAGSSSGPSLQSAIASGQASSNLDETLAAVIGHVPSNPHVPTSLELPITVTNPVIAKTSTASNRMNAAATLFPLTTTATAVSSLAGGDTISAVVLVSGGADVPGTIDRVVPSTSPPLAIPPVQKGGQTSTGEGEALQEMVVADEGKPPCPLSGEPTIADESCAAEDDEDDIQIPNTPESQQGGDRQQQRLDDEFSDDDGGRLEGDGYEPNDTRNHLPVDEDEANSNCSEIIAIQPNVVVLDAGLLLNSPPNDDGIDDEMDNDSEDEVERNEQLVVRAPLHPQQPQQHRSRHVAAAARSTNGEGDGRPDTLNLAEHHNSSNNDSGIDTSMAGAGGGVGGGSGGGAGCEATVSSGVPVRSSTIVER